MLARKPEDIALNDIIQATEGDLLLVECREKGAAKTTCEFDEACVTQFVWQEAAGILNDYFATISLQDLCLRGEAMGVKKEQHERVMYHI